MHRTPLCGLKKDILHPLKYEEPDTIPENIFKLNFCLDRLQNISKFK